MTWHTGPMVGFDLETTGTDVETDRIVTACVVAVGAGPATARTWLADPGVEIPPEAAAVHGVTTERARAEGRPAGEVVAEIVNTLHATTITSVAPVVAMNAAFDLTLLDREARRHGVMPLTDRLPLLRVIDPRVLDKEMDRYRRGGRRLEDLCGHYAVRHDGAHSADGDALAACRVAWRIGQLYPEIAGLPLDALHEAQVRWARQQAESLADYFARTPGKEAWAAGVRTEWPLIPVGEVTSGARP